MTGLFTLITPQIRARYADSYDGAEAIIAVPFNTDRDGKPNVSDQQIAKIIGDFSVKLGLPIYVQREHAEALALLGIQVHAVYPTKPDEWVQTHRLVRWMASVIGTGKRVIVIGHPHHVRRVAALVEHFGLLPLVARESETVPYDYNAPFRHARAPWYYIPWEYASRAALIGMWLTGKL